MELEINFIFIFFSFARVPIGRTRKAKQQPLETIPAASTAADTATMTDEEGNTSECSQRHTSSSVYSTLESSSGNANFYTQQPNVISNQPTSSSTSPDKYHNDSNQNQNSHLTATEISNVE